MTEQRNTKFKNVQSSVYLISMPKVILLVLTASPICLNVSYEGSTCSSAVYRQIRLLSLSLTKAVNGILTHNVASEYWQKDHSSDFSCFIKSTLNNDTLKQHTRHMNWFWVFCHHTSETVTEQRLHQGHTV